MLLQLARQKRVPDILDPAPDAYFSLSFSCTDPVQAFDFLIAGELLRQPLEKFLLAHSVSTVSTRNKQAKDAYAICYLTAINLMHSLPDTGNCPQR